MLKILLKTIFGLLFLTAGFGIGYFYLTNIDNGYSALLLLLALFVVIVGIYLLVQASKSNESVIQKPKISPPDDHSEETKQKIGLLEKNNALTQDWLKTSEKRDKLKLLEMVANEEESAKKY